MYGQYFASLHISRGDLVELTVGRAVGRAVGKQTGKVTEDMVERNGELEKLGIVLVGRLVG